MTNDHLGAKAISRIIPPGVGTVCAICFSVLAVGADSLLAQTLEVKTRQVNELVGIEAMEQFGSDVLAVGKFDGAKVAILVEAITDVPPDQVTFLAEQANWQPIPFARDGNRILIKHPGKTRVWVIASGQVKWAIVDLETVVVPVKTDPYAALTQMVRSWAAGLPSDRLSKAAAAYRSCAARLRADPDGPVAKATKDLNESLAKLPRFNTQVALKVWNHLISVHWRDGMTGSELAPFYDAVADGLD